MGRPSSPFYRKDRDVWITRVDGEQFVLARGKHNKAEALREFYRVMGEAARPKKVTVQTICDHCLEWTRENRATLTVQGYEYWLGRFCQRHGTNNAANVIPQTVLAWLTRHPSWGHVSRHNAISAVKRAFNLAVKDGLLEANPIAKMENPAPPVDDGEIGQDKIDLMFAAIQSPQFRDLMEFLVETGCRPGEARAIEARHLEIGHQVLSLASKTTNRTRKLRRIYLSDRAREIVERLVSLYPNGPIFRNSRGHAWTRFAITNQLQRIRKRSGLGHEVVAGMLRKRWITDALEKGVPVMTVAELAGHSSTKMIESVYSKLSQRHSTLREAVNTIRPKNI